MIIARHVARRHFISSSQMISRYPLPLCQIYLRLPSSRRSLSSPVSSPRPAPPPTEARLTATQRKQKLDLRPSPVKLVKPSTLSATHIPTKPTSLHITPSNQPRTPSLHAIKEVTRRDIDDAEAHGILASPPTDANWFKRTLHKGIELAKFYYRGIKLIFIRRKQIKLIHFRIQAGGSSLTRWEYRLIRTQKSDLNKVAPFLFIALLLEEVIPLIAIYAPFMLPSTCILPSQRDRIEAKRTEKAIAAATQFRHIFSQLTLDESPSGHIRLDHLRTDGASRAVCGILGLSTIGFDALRIRRIRGHLQFLVDDDQLLLQDHLKDNHLENLSRKELETALQERGIVTRGLTSTTMESLLKWWLQSVGQSTSETRRLHILVHRLGT